MILLPQTAKIRPVTLSDLMGIDAGPYLYEERVGGAILRGRFGIQTKNSWGQITRRQFFKNGCTTLGLNAMLDGFFGGGSVTTNWYIGLISNTGYTTLSATDTIASHAGWAEDTNYSGTRVAWGSVSAVGGVRVNTTAAEVTMTADDDLRGGFLVNQNTIGGTTGLLYSTAALASPRAYTTSEVLQMFYESTLTPG